MYVGLPEGDDVFPRPQEETPTPYGLRSLEPSLTSRATSRFRRRFRAVRHGLDGLAPWVLRSLYCGHDESVSQSVGLIFVGETKWQVPCKMAS